MICKLSPSIIRFCRPLMLVGIQPLADIQLGVAEHVQCGALGLPISDAVQDGQLSAVPWTNKGTVGTEI